MLEFLSLAEILRNWEVTRKGEIIIDNTAYNWDAVYTKYKSLAKELLSPYVIDKSSKE